MKKFKKLLIATILLFSFAFIAVGYAALSSQLFATGTASTLYAEVPGIKIIGIGIESTTGGAKDLGSNYEAPTNVICFANATQTSSITYKITVENTSGATYWYRGIVFSNTLSGYQNNLVNQPDSIVVTTKDKPTDTSGTFDTEDWVPPYTVREFYVTYTFGAKARGDLKTIINFSFGEKVLSYGDEVLAILNTPERYEIISNAFNELYQETGSTVLGNVGADAALFEELFDSKLELDGQKVTLLIERKDVDGKQTGDGYEPSGPAGCEYTLYLTTQDPTTGKPTVYAVTYTTDQNGEWRQIGELYEGTASMGTYVDSDGSSHTVFNVGTWAAVKKTYVIFSYGGRTAQYMVGHSGGNAYQSQTTIKELMSMEDIELYNMLDDHPLLRDTYNALKEHQNSDAAEVVLLRNAYNNAVQYYNVRNEGKEFKVIRGVYTRAEIIANLEALAQAMEYYQQTHQTNHG